MAKKLRKLLAAMLVIAICAGIATPAFAAENATTQFRNDVMLNVEAGEDPFVFMIAQDPANNFYYYETSNHTVQVTGGGAVHLIPMVDTQKIQGEWIPDGIYNCGNSNYEVMYCCDAITGTGDGTYYKRVNLEDSEYFTDLQAKRLRAIVANSYPYVSVEEAKAYLKEAGFAFAEDLDRSELISATQAAIWALVNTDSDDNYRYTKTASDAKKAGWGGFLHDFSSESNKFDATISGSGFSRGYKDDKAAGDRINALIDFLLALPGVDAEAGQIVITELDISKSNVGKSTDLYTVALNVSLNHGADSDDNVKLEVYINGAPVGEAVAVGEATEYALNVEAKANDKIKVVVNGTQNLERGVYFYAPEPQDIDGDGIATSREVSQNLIGVAMGETPVYAEAEVTVRKIDKTSTDLDGDFVDVTLEVTGKVDYNSGDKLPVDIIYILGRFLSLDKVKSDSMIAALTETFRDLIKDGVPVNFGIVPYSSTKDPVLPFVSLTTEADLETLPEIIADAIAEAGNVYDQVNMENALLTATEMFSETELGKMDRTDRQHLVMIASGHTYYFNSGDNNENIATVPVRFTKGAVDTNEIFYMEKAWMRARNNCTNSYPIPMAFVNEYKANPDKYESLWDCYWTYIDMWAQADIAAGDTIVYNATTREAGDFVNWFNSGKYSVATGSDGKGGTFTYTGHGAVISNPNPDMIENILKFDLDYAGTQCGPNPFEYDFAAHAISYERAMWEAYTFIQENITEKGINFYPIYNPLRDDGTATNGSTKYYSWCDQFIGHSFMNMLAGGEAITFDANNVTFFDDIKAEITGNSGAASGEATIPFVEDFIGVDFDFTGNKIVLTFNGVAYTTNVITTAEGATASYEFVDENGKVGFTMDYFKGSSKEEERFVWYFYQSVGAEDTVTLTYQLELVERNETPGMCYIAYTNESATLYPNGDRSYGQLFPRPFVEYCNPVQTPPTITFEPGKASNISFMLIDKTTGKVTFLSKIDIEDQTSFEIPTEEGKISAVFVKQSTSGMFWFAEKVDETTQQAVINCLKANNPSYKGYNAIAFGEGAHTLEFKKNKFATYIFDNGDNVFEEVKETEIKVNTEATNDATNDETTVETSNSKNSKNNKNNNKKNKNK